MQSPYPDHLIHTHQELWQNALKDYVQVILGSWLYWLPLVKKTSHCHYQGVCSCSHITRVIVNLASIIMNFMSIVCYINVFTLYPPEYSYVIILNTIKLFRILFKVIFLKKLIIQEQNLSIGTPRKQIALLITLFSHLLLLDMWRYLAVKDTASMFWIMHK